MKTTRQLGKPTIPTIITVHLGKPDDKNAENITIPFIDYLKNVACSEIYPSWPDASLRSNIMVQTTFALNRIYNEWYPSRGYNFDITSLPSYDQTYKKGRDLFDNIVKIVDETFNNYIVKENRIEPYFTQYCDGKNTLCKGLSQWGTVTLANQGKTPLEILKHYYGNDISIIRDAQVMDPITSYPGFPLKLGDMNEHVRVIKFQLNRIAVDYPALDTFDPIHEYYDVLMQQAIRKFQNIFDLNVTGMVDKATWYKIKYLYNAVKRLSDLYSEGTTYTEISEAEKYGFELKKGDTGPHIRGLHYYLKVIAYFDDNIAPLPLDSIYDENTEQMVLAFQKEYGLPETKIVDAATWNKINEVYLETINNLPNDALEHKSKIYPGRVLSLGMEGDDIKNLQGFLKQLHQKNTSYPDVYVWGCFDTKTEEAVKYLQREMEIPDNGAVGPVEWEYMINLILAN